MFSNIEVDNTPMEVQELCDIDPPRQLKNVNTTNIASQNSTNQSNNNNCIGNGVLTVSIK